MENFIYKPSTRISTGKLDLKEVLRPYAEGAEARKKEEGIEKTIKDVYAICEKCLGKMKGGEMNE